MKYIVTGLIAFFGLLLALVLFGVAPALGVLAALGTAATVVQRSLAR